MAHKQTHNEAALAKSKRISDRLTEDENAEHAEKVARLRALRTGHRDG